ncbi:MAG TPA: hypothetical protein VL944_03505 [Candidatus Acidoferrum sp.]|nr:hypothetical protein [Candidatus Acidoferrum sp.]
MPTVEASPTREWRPLPTRNFREMDFQERVEAIGAASNYYGKVAIQLTMRHELPYTGAELYHSLMRTLGISDKADMPFSRSTPFDYCRESLWPISAVVKGVVKKNSRNITAFVKSQDSEEFFLPMAARFLVLADQFDISLVTLLGDTASPGIVRRGYVMASTMQNLYDANAPLPFSTIIERIGGNHFIGGPIEQLKSAGLVDYSKAKIDPLGESERGYAVATLKMSREEVGQLISEEGRLESALIGTKKAQQKRLYFSRLAIRAVLADPPQSIDCESLAKSLDINRSHACKVVTALCEIGVYQRDRETGERTSVWLTDRGRYAYEYGFVHGLRVSLDPSYASTPEYRGAYEELGRDGIIRLLSREKRRYVDQKVNNTPGRVAEFAGYIHEALLRRYPTGEPFRVKEVSGLVQEDRPRIAAAFKLLREQNVITPTHITLSTQDGPKEVSRGYYRLREAPKSE